MKRWWISNRPPFWLWIIPIRKVQVKNQISYQLIQSCWCRVQKGCPFFCVDSSEMVSPNMLGWRYIFFLVIFLNHAARSLRLALFRRSPSCFCQLGIRQIRKDAEKAGKTKSREILSSWWFQRLFMFTLIWGDDPIWRSYFSDGWEEKHQLVLIFGGSGVSKNTGDAKYLGSPACLW